MTMGSVFAVCQYGLGLLKCPLFLIFRFTSLYADCTELNTAPGLNRTLFRHIFMVQKKNWLLPLLSQT